MASPSSFSERRASGLHAAGEPHEQGLLEVGGGHRVYWEVRGNARGKPAVVVHGGPGSGCTPAWARLFDPDAYRIVLLDQRGCGRSHPHAGRSVDALQANTTPHLIGDLERLRTHLGIERWLVLGASWGSVLGLAYAQAHPQSVSEIVLFSLASGSRGEVRWMTRGAGAFFPEQWRRFRDGVPEAERDGDLAEAYRRLLTDPDPAVCAQAAQDWCDWDDRQMRTPGEAPRSRYKDPVFRLCSARLVTHYWAHNHWLPDDALLNGAGHLAGIPGALIHGRLDLVSPVDLLWRLSRAWPESQLTLIDTEGHSGGNAMNHAITHATDAFAAHP
jgi:proline iminopeptidase